MLSARKEIWLWPAMRHPFETLAINAGNLKMFEVINVTQKAHHIHRRLPLETYVTASYLKSEMVLVLLHCPKYLSE
jgi:hypothetical protein